MERIGARCRATRCASTRAEPSSPSWRAGPVSAYVRRGRRRPVADPRRCSAASISSSPSAATTTACTAASPARRRQARRREMSTPGAGRARGGRRPRLPPGALHRRRAADPAGLRRAVPLRPAAGSEGNDLHERPRHHAAPRRPLARVPPLVPSRSPSTACTGNRTRPSPGARLVRPVPPWRRLLLARQCPSSSRAPSSRGRPRDGRVRGVGDDHPRHGQAPRLRDVLRSADGRDGTAVPTGRLMPGVTRSVATKRSAACASRRRRRAFLARDRNTMSRTA